MTRRRVLLLALALAVAVVLAAVAALFMLPGLMREVAVWQLQALTGRPVTIDALDLSLASGRFSVRGFRVADRDGGRLADFERLEGRFHPRALLGGHLWIAELTLTSGHVRIVRLEPNRFNVSDLLDRPARTGGALDVSVDRFSLAGGSSVVLEDRVLRPARTWRSDDIRLDARNVSTREPRGTAVGSTTIAGALVTLRVEALRLAPVHLRAWVNVRDLDLRLAALYLPADGPLVLERGGLDAGVSVAVDARDGVLVNADAVIERLALRRPGMDGDALTAPELRVMVRDLHQRPGSLVLRYASVGGDLTVLDPTTAPPRRLTFADFTATASGLEQPMTGLAQVAVHASVPGGGEIDIGGTVGLEPRRADLRVRPRGIELATLARYLPIPGRLEGIARADVRIRAASDRTLELAVSGDATLERVALGDGSRTLAGAARLTATGLQYTWPATLRVGQLMVSRPSATIERDDAGALGLAALVRPAAEPGGPAPAPPAATPGAAAALDIGITRLQIEDGNALVSDAASGTRVEARRVAVTAEDVTWPGHGPARVRVSAAVAGAEVSAQGTVDAGRRHAEVALRVRGGDLAMFQPWLPIAGRVRGTADADVRVVASHDGTLRLTVTGDTTLQRVALLDGSRPLAGAARIAASGAEYTWPATVRVARLTLTRPTATVERATDGQINLASLLRPAAPPGAAATPPPQDGEKPPAAADLTLRRLRIEDGHAVVTDAASGGRVEVGRLALTARDVTWPARGEVGVRLSAAVPGGVVTARGTVDPAQRRGQLTLTVRGVDVAALQPWLPIAGRVHGAADADVAVAAELEPFALSVRGRVGAANVAFLDGEQPLLTVGRVDADGVDLRWPTRLEIDRLRVDTPWTKIARDPRGELSLRALFAPRPDRPAPAATETGPGPVPGLHLTVRDALFENGGASIVDDAVEPAARFELRGSRLALRDASWPARGPAAVQLTTPMPGRGGTLTARGTFSIEPTRLALEVDLDQVDLAPGRPYLPIDARLSGRLSGRAKVNGSFGETIALAIDGDVAVERLALGDDDRRLATARRAALAGVRYRFPTSIRVKQLTLDRPWVLFERSSDGSFEWVSLLKARQPLAGAGAPAAGDPRPPARQPRVRVVVDDLRLGDGFVRFVDRSTSPHYAEELAGIVLTAEGLATRPSRRAKVALSGTLASGTPLTVHGELGGLMGPRFLDLTVAVRDFPLPRLNSYLDRLVAWVARQGTLTATLRYRVDGDELEAVNDVTLTGVEVERAGGGGEVQRRVGPPLDTLVSLLKNREGIIKLNVPVHGRLSAPEFHYGEAVWAAVRNLVIRLVALPFSLVGKLFFTEDSRIEAVSVDPVTFQIARAAPTPAGAQQLERLTAFLKQAPAIRLRLRPVTTVADVAALRREALDSRLAALGADAAARRRAAVGLYTELFPRRQPPVSDEALLEELTRETPTPPRALRALAAGRVAETRDALVRAGIPPERLEPLESRAAVESEGTARVEFEITH
ncbi:MAG TPA: DUF748 domain-containing protein [Methylomirabilota bacterium]|nr:DUF748 domain-containing protein [Methylomirabilota bacterium]